MEARKENGPTGGETGGGKYVRRGKRRGKRGIEDTGRDRTQLREKGRYIDNEVMQKTGVKRLRKRKYVNRKRREMKTIQEGTKNKLGKRGRKTARKLVKKAGKKD